MAALPGARELVGGGLLLGVSAHCLADVGAAAEAGADYVTLSPVFPTASKPGYGPALGTEAIAAARGLGLPVIALGGLAVETVVACREAGAAGFAVLGEVMRSEEPTQVAARLLAAWEVEAPFPPSLRA